MNMKSAQGHPKCPIFKHCLPLFFGGEGDGGIAKLTEPLGSTFSSISLPGEKMGQVEQA